MPIIELDSLTAPEAAMFCRLTEAELRTDSENAEGIFIAESPKVISVALDAGYAPISLLCERKHIEGDASEIIARAGNIPVYTGSRELLSSITGYKLTRGVLCAMRRRPLPSPHEVMRGASRIAVINAVCDTTNIGAIFRSAAALGVNGIILTPNSCDPLNRRAVRVSMGSVFLIPWTFDEDPVATLKDAGFTTIALALSENSVSLDDPSLLTHKKLAMVLGTEGDGLPHEVIAKTDITVKIPMMHGVDSLNVAAASAVAFWQLRDVKAP